MKLTVTHLIEVGDNLSHLLHRLLGKRSKRRARRQRARLIISRVEYLDSHIVLKGEISMASLRENEQVRFTVTPRTAKGNVGKVQAGSVEWSSSDPAIATVEEDPTNELSAVVKAVGPEGSATITFTADADLSDGVRPVSGLGAVQVIAGDTVGFSLEEGTPEPQA